MRIGELRPKVIRKIEMQVALHVMGMLRVEEAEKGEGVVRNKAHRTAALKHYCSDKAAANEVKQKMQDEGWVWELTTDKELHTVSATYPMENELGVTTTKQTEAFIGPSREVCICLVALDMIGHRWS